MSIVAPNPVRSRFDQLQMRSRLPFHADFRRGQLDALSGQAATLTRASVGTLLDADGKVYDKTDARPRYQMHDLDGDGIRESPALLLEGQATNLVDDQDLTTWSVGGTPNVSQSDAGPDGKDSGYTVDDDDAGVDEDVRKAVSFTGDAVKAIGVWVKEGSGEARVRIRDTTAGADHLDMRVTAFDSGTGEPTVTESTGSLLGKVRGRDGWWRLLCQTTSVTAANTHLLLLHAAIGSASTGSALYALPHAEDAEVPSSDITTSGSTVSRSAETAYWEYLPTPQALTAYFKFIDLGAGGTGNNPRLFYIGNAAGTAPYFNVYRSSEGRLTLQHGNGTSTVTGADVSAHELLDIIEVRAVLFSDGAVQMHKTINGAAEESGSKSSALALASAWNDTRLYVGSFGGTRQAPAAFTAVKVAFGERTLAQMQVAF